MTEAQRISRACFAIAVCVVVVAVGRYVSSHWGGVYDDALIYLRYVKNLRSGCGLRWNCDGPAVEGFTGPLYLAVLWLGSFATRQWIDLCQGVCTASLSLAVIAGAGLMLRLGQGLVRGTPAAPDAVPAGDAVEGAARGDAGHGPLSPWLPAGLVAAFALAVLLDDFVLLNAITGMETALGAAVLTAIALAAVANRPRLLMAALGAGLLVRPETMVFVVALPMLPALRRPRYVIAIVAIVAAIAVARFAIFGAFAPNTYYAKAGGTWRHAELGAAYLANVLVDFPLILGAPLALLVPAGRLRRACAYLLVASAAWLAFFLRSGGDLFEYSRLAFPLVPMLSVLALVGIAAATSRVSGRLVIAVPVAIGLAIGARALAVHGIPPQGASPRVVEWAAVGSYLRKHFPGATIATVPIGAIGYYSQLPLIDLVGLTEPEIARAGRSVPSAMLTKKWIGHERHCTECVLARAPRVIVTTMSRDTPWRTLAETRAGFYADWLLLQEIKAGRAPYDVHDAEVMPGDHVLMFVRRP